MTTVRSLFPRTLAPRWATWSRARTNQPGRSYWNILSTNLFSFFNLILFAVSLILLAFGRNNDAFVTGVTALLSALIRTGQEIRAKQQLDQIALLVHPQAMVVRDGDELPVAAAELRPGDLIHLRTGDQALADGEVSGDSSAEVDESLLTGESDLVRKRAGDRIFSGSFCVSGAVHYVADAVGEESYTGKLAKNAKTYHPAATPLERQITLIIRLLMVMTVGMALVFYIGGVLGNNSVIYFVTGSAVIVGLVPYGYFLTISLAYTLGALTISRHGAIVQHTNAVELLQHVNVLCLDKTGTLTANSFRVQGIDPLGPVSALAVRHQLGDFAWSITHANTTIHALRQELPGRQRTVVDEVPFVSARKWSAVALADQAGSAVVVLGAWEMLRGQVAATHQAAIDQAVQARAEQGLRVLLFAHAPGEVTLHPAGATPRLPGLEPLALVALADELRPHAQELLDDYRRMGVAVKIISGDSPHTVAALASQVGLTPVTQTSGPELAALSPADFAQTAADTTIFGRISPDQKAQLIAALRGQGRTVAMIGDGVNDILALKQANLAIAMQSGSSATRAVADLILRHDSYQALAPAMTEGRRIINGLTNAAYLTLSRAFTYAFVIVAVLMVGIDFPFEPAQTGVTLLTVGLPALMLTLWARPQAPAEPLSTAVVRFMLPVAVWSALIGVTLYSFVYFRATSALEMERIPPGLITRFEAYTGLTYDAGAEFGLSAARIIAQTTLSVFLSFSALLMLLFLEPPTKLLAVWRPVSPDRRPAWLALGLILLLVVALYIQPVAIYLGFIPLIGPNWREIAVALIAWGVGLWLVWRYQWIARLLKV